MTRLTDLPPGQAKRLAELECPDFPTRPWMSGPGLSQRRVAIISSAGLVVRGENPVRGRDPDYRTIAATIAANDLLLQPYLDQFRPNRVSGRLEASIFPLERLL